MLLGALSVLMLGAIPASATTGDATPPCHEAAGSHPDVPAHQGNSGKALAAMACCVSCVITPVMQPPPRDLAPHAERPAAPVPASLPVGLSPAPEPGPPKA